jgi:hypothetical protein
MKTNIERRTPDVVSRFRLIPALSPTTREGAGKNNHGVT